MSLLLFHTQSHVIILCSHLNLKVSIAQAHSGLDMLGHGMTNQQPENNKCTVQLAVIQGTLDRPSSEMTVVQVQSLVGRNHICNCASGF